MEIVKSVDIKKPVIVLKILEDKRLLVIDSDTTIRYYNLAELKLVSGFKVGIKHARYKTNMVSVCNNGEFLVTASEDTRESRLYNTITKKAIAKVDRHQGEISCVGVDPLGRYMFSCGDDGKTFAIDTKSGKLVFTLPVHVDTVNDIAFSSNGNWVATASYDKKVSLFNLATMTTKAKLKAHASPIVKLLFLGHEKLVSADKNSTVIVWDVHTAKLIERLQGVHDDVTQMVTDKENKFLFIGTALGYVLLYDMKTYEQLSRKYIKLSSSITALEFNEETNELIVASEDGNVAFYNIYEGAEALGELLKRKEFTAIRKAAEVNPVLAYTKIFDLVENMWEITLTKAKLALQKGDKNTAILLFKNFKNIPEKNRIMQKVMLEYGEFEKFVTLAKAGKLPLAYGIANVHPLYKDSGIYKSLEKNWQKAFTKAQKYVLEPKGADKAKDILAPYRGISDKTMLIQELLTQGEIYKRFRVSIGQKDFRLCFELIKQHPFLKEFPEYETIMSYADTLYIKSQKSINEGDTHSAIKMLRILADFTDFAQEVKELIDDISNKQKFFKAIEEKDIALAYNMLASTEELLDTKDGQVLQAEWNSDLTLANKYAVNGNINGVKEALNKYMNISSKYAALATVFGWCYMVQLEQAIQEKRDRFEIENGIKNYVLSFGVQDQIESFFNLFSKRYKDTKLNIEQLTKGSMSMWRPSMIQDSILE